MHFVVHFNCSVRDQDLAGAGFQGIRLSLSLIPRYISNIVRFRIGLNLSYFYFTMSINPCPDCSTSLFFFFCSSSSSLALLMAGQQQQAAAAAAAAAAMVSAAAANPFGMAAPLGTTPRFR